MFFLINRCFQITPADTAYIDLSKPDQKVFDVNIFTKNSNAKQQARLTLQRKIGAGGASIVYGGLLSQAEVACKKYRHSLFTCYMQEKSILQQLDHPNIVKLIAFLDYQFLDLSLLLVMEFAENGDLGEYLITHQGKSRDRALLNQFSIDIIKGLIYLHELGYIHRDIKAPNILLTSTWKAIIADFSSTLQLWERETSIGSTMKAGTISWAAPEVHNDWIDYTAAYDIYSFGWLLWCMATKNKYMPYQNLSFKNIAKAHQRGNLPDIPNSLPPTTQMIIRQCWEKDPNKRPTAEQIHSKLSQSF